MKTFDVPADKFEQDVTQLHYLVSFARKHQLAIFLKSFQSATASTERQQVGSMSELKPAKHKISENPRANSDMLAPKTQGYLKRLLDAKNQYSGATALHLACTPFSIDAKSLDEYIQKKSVKKQIATQAIGAELENDRVQILSLLIGARADIEAFDDIGRTPLLIAACLDNKAAYDFLLEKGADATVTIANNQKKILEKVTSKLEKLDLSSLSNPKVSDTVTVTNATYSLSNRTPRELRDAKELYRRQLTMGKSYSLESLKDCSSEALKQFEAQQIYSMKNDHYKEFFNPVGEVAPISGEDSCHFIELIKNRLFIAPLPHEKKRIKKFYEAIDRYCSQETNPRPKVLVLAALNVATLYQRYATVACEETEKIRYHFFPLLNPTQEFNISLIIDAMDLAIRYTQKNRPIIIHLDKVSPLNQALILLLVCLRDDRMTKLFIDALHKPYIDEKKYFTRIEEIAENLMKLYAVFDFKPYMPSVKYIIQLFAEKRLLIEEKESLRFCHECIQEDSQTTFFREFTQSLAYRQFCSKILANPKHSSFSKLQELLNALHCNPRKFFEGLNAVFQNQIPQQSDEDLIITFKQLIKSKSNSRILGVFGEEHLCYKSELEHMLKTYNQILARIKPSFVMERPRLKY